MTISKSTLFAAVLVAAATFAPKVEAATWYWLACNSSPTTGNVWADFFTPTNAYGETASGTYYVQYNTGDNIASTLSSAKLSPNRCSNYFAAQAQSFADSFLLSHPAYSRAEWHYSGSANVLKCTGDYPNGGQTDICYTYSSTPVSGSGTASTSGSGGTCGTDCDIDGPGPIYKEK